MVYFEIQDSAAILPNEFPVSFDVGSSKSLEFRNQGFGIQISSWGLIFWLGISAVEFRVEGLGFGFEGLGVLGFGSQGSVFGV